jgi:D-alanine-D-alanine ligase-like ATP-grasp enzyme
MPLLRPKGYLGATGHAIAVLLIAVPLVMIAARLLALPGMRIADWPLFVPLAQLGEALDSAFTLAWVPPPDRKAVDYLLFMPTATLLIVLARLTFGLRVLGYRSILIAVGFRVVGILPSAVVMLVVFGVVALLRPGMRQARLPLYARVSLILAITACLMVSFLFVGMWQRSELIWSLAFFPVIILAMMAEAIAAALDTNTMGTALWRLGWTLLLALGMYYLMQSSFMSLIVYAPELMLLQLGLIVLISEYLDLKLLQDWQARSAAFRAKYTPWWIVEGRRPRVAIVRNRSQSGTIARLGPQAPPEVARAPVQHLVDGLRDLGYSVKVLEGDMTLLRELRKFLPPNPRTGAPGGVVFNLSEGIQGEDRHTHVPAMLEMGGIAYTGPTPAGHARIDDILMQRIALEHAGVPAAPEGAIGREVHVGILGRDRLSAFPLALMTRAGQFQCPAKVSDAEAVDVRDRAFSAFRATGCRDFAVVRVVLTPEGKALVAGVSVQGVFGLKSSTASMLRAAGLGWGYLAREIVELAAARNDVEWVTQRLAKAPAAALAGPAGARS